MANILIIDDVEDNLIVLDILIEEYMEDKEIENYTITSTTNASKGLQIVDEKNIDIIFLDIMMPKMDGFEFLKILRNTNLQKQPIVVMATALGDRKTKQKEQEYGANAYMVKPVSLKVVTIMLDKFLEVLNNNNTEFDFDDFDFDDFDFDNLEEEKENEDNELEKIVKKSYISISASNFMEEYEYIAESIESHLEDLELLIFDVFESADDDLNLTYQIQSVIKIFEAYQEFLSKFTELIDLFVTIDILSNILQNLNISKLSDKQKENISKFIKSIIFDLNDFKEQVFITKEAENIYYLNASIASSCIQIEYML